MRISKLVTGKIAGAVLAAAVLLAQGSAALSEEVAFKSAMDARKQGISAFSGGYYELAVPALKYAAERQDVVSSYYLARIYADNAGSFTDHKAAFETYQKIADEYADIDPADDPRAPYVGKSLTALAGYMLRGLPEVGLRPSPELAADFLNNASLTFNDDDAQFELAKLQLKGEGVSKDVSKAKHWLATLSRKGHAGAQAFLADLMWRGLYMDKNQGQALALISVAVANAPSQDRLWIEDIHQNIYCGAGEGIRRQAGGIVASWGDRYTATRNKRQQETIDRSGLGALNAQALRTCENGEPVGGLAVNPHPDGVDIDASTGQSGGFMRGGALGNDFRRDVGATTR